MKKQYLYIFYSENSVLEKYGIPEKLVKTYMNHFCINEENQSEVIEIHPLKDFRKFSNESFSNNSFWDVF